MKLNQLQIHGVCSRMVSRREITESADYDRDKVKFNGADLKNLSDMLKEIDFDVLEDLEKFVYVWLMQLGHDELTASRNSWKPFESLSDLDGLGK